MLRALPRRQPESPYVARMTSPTSKNASTSAVTQGPTPAGTAPNGIDPRGARFGAAITTVVLAIVLLTWDTLPSLILLGLQTFVFALGAAAGPSRQPYATVFARLVRPRLGPPRELEDPRPPRFAQLVGLTFTGAALVAVLAGLPLLGLILTAGALIAALLNAAFGLCLGCEMYLIIVRLTRRGN